MKTVIFIKSSELSAYRKKQAGIQQYAKERNWNIQIMEPIASAKDAERIIDLWNPDGCIIDCGSGARLGVLRSMRSRRSESRRRKIS